MAIFKRNHLFQTIILGIHVSFRGCIIFVLWPGSFFLFLDQAWEMLTRGWKPLLLSLTKGARDPMMSFSDKLSTCWKLQVKSRTIKKHFFGSSKNLGSCPLGNIFFNIKGHIIPSMDLQNFGIFFHKTNMLVQCDPLFSSIDVHRTEESRRWCTALPFATVPQAAIRCQFELPSPLTHGKINQEPPWNLEVPEIYSFVICFIEGFTRWESFESYWLGSKVVNTWWTLQYKLIQPRCHSSYSGNNFPWVMDNSFKSSCLWPERRPNAALNRPFSCEKFEENTYTPTHQPNNSCHHSGEATKILSLAMVPRVVPMTHRLQSFQRSVKSVHKSAAWQQRISWNIAASKQGSVFH